MCIRDRMLVDAGVKYVVLGHSERRDYFKEDDALLNKKVKKAFEKGLTPILCCGETLEQREMGITLDWIRLQIKSDLKDVTAEQVASMVIAYEPIWAIGTGKTAVSYTHLDVYKRQTWEEPMTKSNGYCDKISVYSAARCGCKPSSMPRRTGSFAAYFS